MVLIFYSFKGFSDLDLDMQVFQIWKTSGLEVESSPMSPFHNKSERFCDTPLPNVDPPLVTSVA
ncbi:hypothetical protein F2Q70_00016273 [Brassica cretica]|uniref:Uncharacterized protein n=1 Tax=Brassica cretica TaxID=69181 RepID=A0A8S9I3Y2_BRACR|nr:hypothetical protein F2Q70_00016273 [Brassica cretica]KAF2596418.1 hypothetical protein F2Q68_00009253 [Brassica cretica]